MTTTATPANLEVIDPCNRTGKIVIPMCYVSETRGIHEQNRPKDSKDLSLCLLFQKGRCNAGPRCHQVHADPTFVNKLRAQASAGSACCALHGDFQSSSYLNMSSKSVEVHTNGVVSLFPIIAFGRTAALDSLLGTSSETIKVNSSKICRLHTQGRCKFGRDCKNIHLCPKARPASPSKPAPLAPSWANQSACPKLQKAAIHLDISKSELEAASFCGLSSCPDTPEGKSFRSSSLRSTMTTSPSPAPSSGASTPGESPKEFGLFNRTVMASPAPIQKPSRSTEQLQSMSVSALDCLFAMPMLSLPARSPTFEPAEGFEATASLIAADIAGATVSPSWTL